MNVVLSLLTATLSAVFTVVLVRKFVARLTPYYGVWALGLLWYAISTAAQAAGAVSHWTPMLFRVWYLAGAIGVAAYLGAGTLYLHPSRAFGMGAVACILLGGLPALAEGAIVETVCVAATGITCAVVLVRAPRLYPHVAFAALVLGSLAAAAVIFTSAVDVSVLPSSADEIVTGAAASSSVRILTPAFNIAGASIVLLGAVTSAITFVRRRREPRRALSNVLIAVGAFVPSLTSGLTRFGLTSGFFLGQLVGVACLLAGFLLATTPRAASHQPTASALPAQRSPEWRPRRQEP